jgi:DNA polymerase-4
MALQRRATILHADLDAFYASVEQLLDPSLRARPIAVGGGVVLAASYEARAFGVEAGMPGWRAKNLCPALRFVDGHFREYQRLGDQVIEVMRDFTPVVERVSIDEAFLDVAGSVHLFGPPADMAEAIRRRVATEIGLPLSVGVARTKHLAKVASQVAKPDGLVVVQPEEELAFLGPLPVGLMWGVGPATRARLAAHGISTIGDLAAAQSPMLESLLGRAVGAKLGSLAANLDPRSVESARPVSSVGAQSALGRRRATPELLRSTLGYLADRVAGRLRAAGRAGRTITVRVRFTGLRSVTRSLTLALPVSTTLTLSEVATDLALAVLADHPGEFEVTLLAVSVSNLADQPVLQLELPLGLADDRQRPGSALGAARLTLDHSVDAVRARFGSDSVGYAASVFSRDGRVPEAFRELAEHGDLG